MMRPNGRADGWPNGQDETRQQAFRLLPAPEMTARIVRRFTLLAAPNRVELKFSREKTPVFRLDRKPAGHITITYGHTLASERGRPDWDLVQVPNPFPLDPDEITPTLHELVLEAINTHICQLCLAEPAGITPNQTLQDELASLVATAICRNQRVHGLAVETARALRDLINPGTYLAVRDIIQPDGTRRDRSPRRISIWRYNTAASLGDHLAELQKTNPGPTSWLLRAQEHGLPISHPGQVILSARQSLEAHGLNRESWRTCTKLPASMIQALTQQDDSGAAAHIINIIAQAGAVPSEDIAQWAVTLTGTNPWDTRGANVSLALRLIFQESSARQQNEQQDGYGLMREIPSLMDFAQDADRQGATIRARSFTGLTQRSSQWRQNVQHQTAERLMGQAKRKNPAWDSLLDAATVGEYTIIPLTSELDLLREGHHMRHCAATYGEKCLAGNSRLFSIRKGSQRVATIEIVLLENTWRTSQVQGRMNADPAEKTLWAAGEIAQAYTDAWRENLGKSPGGPGVEQR